MITAGAPGGVLQPPDLVFRGRRWSSRSLAAMASAWHGRLAPRLGGSSRPAAMVMDNHPASIAMFFALSAFPAPIILLPRDAESWHTGPPLPPRTPLALLETQRDLAGLGRELDLDVSVVDEPSAPGPRVTPPFLTFPGLVLFTSGSTGKPRPAYRSREGLIGLARRLMAALGLEPGDGIITSLPVARAFGLNYGLLGATVLGSPLALLDRFDHRALLALFASPEYRLWVGTPMMADVLGRCPAPAAPRAPRISIAGGRLSAAIAERFRERFGVPVRQGYGTTESGTIAVDAGPADDVRPDTVGRALAGVEIRVGDDPRIPQPAGTTGRIWLSAPETLMKGYGFPPDLVPPETVDGWWGTPDVGALSADGWLSVSGRLDDCFRTTAGQLVNPALVSLALERHPGVVDAAVVPIATPSGPMLGVLIESGAPVDPVAVREHLARTVPAWSQPRAVTSTDALPRLPSGRIDRRACIAILERSLDAAPR